MNKVTKLAQRVTPMSTKASASVQPIIELREYKLHPAHVKPYLDATIASADVRKSLVPLRLFTLPETGGVLNVPTHFYYYKNGLEERDICRAEQGKSQAWLDYLKVARPCVQEQKSTIFVEAPLVQKFSEICGLAEIPSFSDDSSSQCIYEMRRYKLKLGYDTVPNMLKHYEDGLPSKLSSSGDPSSSLVSILYSEVGLLNEVIEIWRHGHGTSAMNRSRFAAREAKEWRTAIGNIAELAVEFSTTIHKPLSFSPFK